MVVIDKMQGAQLLIDCLSYHYKMYSQVDPEDEADQVARKRLYLAILRALAVCLRADVINDQFIRSKQLNFLKLFKMAEDFKHDRKLVFECLAVLR